MLQVEGWNYEARQDRVLRAILPLSVCIVGWLACARPKVQQQHFIVPALNLNFIPQLELNLGLGIGVTSASNGIFLKSIVGWTF